MREAGLGYVRHPSRVLQRRQILLVLDNCEHVLQACAELVGPLLQACDNLSVLATSREPLGVAGEVEYAVPPLPTASSEASVDRIEQSDAVQLLIARVQAVSPSFELTASNARLAARICGLVDGVPLAIELAAARAKSMSLAEIAERLTDPLKMLDEQPAQAPERHRTLRATLDWSHALLTEPERTLLRRLSVFSDGCTLEAAAAVCGDDGVVADETLELLRPACQPVAGNCRYASRAHALLVAANRRQVRLRAPRAGS